MWLQAVTVPALGTDMESEVQKLNTNVSLPKETCDELLKDVAAGELSSFTTKPPSCLQW